MTLSAYIATMNLAERLILKGLLVVLEPSPAKVAFRSSSRPFTFVAIDDDDDDDDDDDIDEG